MLKIAEPLDALVVTDMLLKFHQHSPYTHIPVEKDYVYDMVSKTIAMDKSVNVIILGQDVEGTSRGMVIGQTAYFPLTGERIASEIAWWVDPEFRKTDLGVDLLTAYEYWAKTVGCKYVQSVALRNEYSHILERFYKSKGYAAMETCYLKEL